MFYNVLKRLKMLKISEYMTINKAAEYLGVTANTLRNWEGAGKIKTYRNPLNNYRLYKKDELDDLLEKIKEKN